MDSTIPIRMTLFPYEWPSLGTKRNDVHEETTFVLGNLADLNKK